MIPTRVFVTGTTGYIGRRLILDLARAVTWCTRWYDDRRSIVSTHRTRFSTDRRIGMGRPSTRNNGLKPKLQTVVSFAWRRRRAHHTSATHSHAVLHTTPLIVPSRRETSFRFFARASPRAVRTS